MNHNCKIICLTPVKNEAWILDDFLKCTSIWADYIIIADQNSTDGSREIARKYPKVILIENNSDEYNELERQKLLLQEARKINEKRLLVALDADEFLTSDFKEKPEWEQILNSKPGSAFCFKWLNISPTLKDGWISPHALPFILMDDNKPHTGEFIHNARLPITKGYETLITDNIYILHFQYVFWERMKSKHRYYQCLELINYPSKDAIDIYRMYHHMYAVKGTEKVPLKQNYFYLYEKEGVKLLKYPKYQIFWFDVEVLNFFKVYSEGYFKKINVWNIDWVSIAKQLNLPIPKDPRSFLDKSILLFLTLTQKYKDKHFVKRIERTIKYRFKW
jgi:glycosyltransferase involved in cell wall biosynthesis